MNSSKLRVQFFTTHSGKEPVRDWLLSLEAIERKTIGNDIKTVQYGWPIGMPLVRKMEPDLWEVRVHLANKIARILFTMADAKTLLLLHGFIKKSTATPREDLELARKRLQQFRSLL